MASSLSFKLACLVLLFMVVGAPLSAQGAISCSTVSSKLGPCITYLKGGPMGSGCCSGLKDVNSPASTGPDRKAACLCLKEAAGYISGLNYGLAAGLPGNCGVFIPYKISPSTDCDTLHQ